MFSSPGGQEKEAEGGKNSEEISEGENSALPLPSGELPAWKKNALETETPHELCIGDVVRARCDVDQMDAMGCHKTRSGQIL